jgi:hypothetical protein
MARAGERGDGVREKKKMFISSSSETKWYFNPFQPPQNCSSQKSNFHVNCVAICCLIIHEIRTLLAICLQNPAWLHMSSLGNFHERQTQLVSRYKKKFLYFPETKLKTTQYFQADLLRYKNIYLSLLYVVCREAIFTFSETESFLTLQNISLLNRL